MPYVPAWQEAESKVYRPGIWLVCLVGTVFALAGGVGFLTFAGALPPGMPTWVAKSLSGVFALLGGFVLAWAIGSVCLPRHVRHAAPDVLPDVPNAPVVCEGSVVHGRLTHELCETAEGWEFRFIRLKRTWSDGCLGF